MRGGECRERKVLKTVKSNNSYGVVGYSDGGGGYLCFTVGMYAQLMCELVRCVLSAVGIIALFNLLVSVVRDRFFWRAFLRCF